MNEISNAGLIASPRPYQEAALEAVVTSRLRGRQRVLVTMPTGTGKTNVFVWLLERLVIDRPALVIAHRDELIRQAADRIAALAPHLEIGVEKAEETAPASSQVVVASVQTLGRSNSRRLEWLEGSGPEVIICDEAHHAPADSYKAIFNRFGAFDGRAFLVGFTATPKRLDAKGLHEVFEEEVYRYELKTAMQDGWLCPIRCFRVVTQTDLSTVGTTAGDFDQGDLARAVNTEERTERAIRHFAEVAAERRALVFCVDVRHAHDTARLFRESGFSAEAVDGAMPLEERRGVLARLRSGETQVVANCGVLTEGFDCPEVAAVVMLRPTKSSTLYTQCVGRGTRPAAGKADLVLIDVVDNCRRHSLMTAPALLGLPETTDLQGNSLLAASELWTELGEGACKLADDPELTFMKLATHLEQVDLFCAINLPEDVRLATRLDWVPVPDGYLLPVAKGYRARLVSDTLGEWRLLWMTAGTKQRSGPLGTDLIAALGRCEQHLIQTWGDMLKLIVRDQGWMHGPASDKQKALLLQRGFPAARVEPLTKGEAHRIIGKLFS